MQDKFVGDANDFGKYGLLRALCGSELRLGVVWYLVRDEEQPDFHRVCDADLYERLRSITEAPNRTVSAIEQGGVLPDSTLFYLEPLAFRGNSVATRRQERDGWWKGAFDAMKQTNVVFLDPDTGLALPERSRTDAKARKYAFLGELLPFLKRGQSVVLYHHLHRNEPHVPQVNKLAKALRSHAPASVRVHPLLFKRGTAPASIVMAAAKHQDVIREHLAQFAASSWSENFDFL